MKNFYSIGIFILCRLAFHQAAAQNPNWTLPPSFYNVPSNSTVNLPAQTGSAYYHGEVSTCLHGAYSDPHGDVLFFTNDDYVYDKNGRTVG